ncbi:MAG: oligosaccharide flippase family protein, partial [Candidatus Micrarchaeia archaeon]
YEITPFIIVLALAYFAQSFQTFAVPYWTIKRNFKRLAVLKIIYGVVFFIANVTLIYLYGLSGLFYAFLLSMVVFTLSLLYKVEHGVFKLSLFKQMIPFAAAMFSTLLLTYVLQNYDTLYLGLFETPANLGYYAVAYILFYPLLLISSALHTVLLPDVSKMSDEKQWNEVSRLFHKSLKSAVIVLTVSIIAFTTAFYGLLQLFFNNYLPVMEYLPWLAIPFVLEAAIGSVCTVFLLAINKAKQVAKIKLFQVAIGVVAGYFLISTLGVWGAITSTWIVYATGSAGYYYYTKKTLECKK